MMNAHAGFEFQGSIRRMTLPGRVGALPRRARGLLLLIALLGLVSVLPVFCATGLAQQAPAAPGASLTIALGGDNDPTNVSTAIQIVALMTI